MLEENVSRKINDLLHEIEDNRRRDLKSSPDTPPTSFHVAALSKEDIMKFFRTHGRPTYGALLGVYRWVADLGTARFNFDFNIHFDPKAFECWMPMTVLVAMCSFAFIMNGWPLGGSDSSHRLLRRVLLL